MLSSDFERFSGREIIVITEATVLLVVQGELAVTRQVEYFGHRWSLDVRGHVMLLRPGTYVVEGEALIFFAADKTSPPSSSGSAGPTSSAGPAGAPRRRALR